MFIRILRTWEKTLESLRHEGECTISGNSPRFGEAEFDRRHTTTTIMILPRIVI